MIRLKHVTRSYPGTSPIHALHHLDLEIAENDFVSITGPSGSGKSTLLHLLACLDSPTHGEIFVHDTALHRLSEKERTHYRRHQVGIVFQFFNLMPTMSVAENVVLPLLLAGESRRNAAPKAEAMLNLVGLTERRHHHVHQLSGGEMQRTAIARALVHQPRLVLADEPTGNLDSRNAEQIMTLFSEIHRKRLTTLVLVTHSRQIAESARREIRLRDGRLETVIDHFSQTQIPSAQVLSQ